MKKVTLKVLLGFVQIDVYCRIMLEVLQFCVQMNANFIDVPQIYI